MSMIYTKIKLFIILIFYFFTRITNKIKYERDAGGALLDFFSEVSIVILTDIITILLTPDIFLIIFLFKYVFKN